jgi:hypothetical protein
VTDDEKMEHEKKVDLDLSEQVPIEGLFSPHPGRDL